MQDIEIKSFGKNSFVYTKFGQTKTSDYKITPKHEAIENSESFRLGWKACNHAIKNKLKHTINTLWKKRFYLLAYSMLVGPPSLLKIHELIHVNAPIKYIEFLLFVEVSQVGLSSIALALIIGTGWAKSNLKL